MLTRLTNTPAPRPEAAPILPPTFTPEVRWQALIEAVKLRARRQSLEMARSIGNPKPADPAKSHYHPENERHLFESRSARSLRLAENVSEFIAIAPTSLNSATTRAADNETITAPLSPRQTDTPAHTHGENSSVRRLTQLQ
jgi:hypothetical protein